MTINEAITKLIGSDAFQEDARKDAKLRVFKQRYLEGNVKSGAAINLLTGYGYRIDITKTRNENNKTGKGIHRKDN